ncbi:DNA polymerase III subunit beta [Candidatus Poribacteria bacterium]|nr:DNA polymerase III subunit beta [Candidatus Poribacteria bacterium]
MKLTTNRDDLITGLLKLEDILNTKDPLSVQSQLRIKTTDNGIELTATDSETTIQTTVACEVIEDGEVILLGKYMTEITQNIQNNDQIEISLNNDNETIKISCSDGLYKLKKSDFSNIPVIPTLHRSKFTIIDQSLHSLINKTQYVVDDESRRRGIDGLYFKMEKDKSEIVATNGSVVLSLAKFNIKKQANESSSSPFILSLKSSKNIMKHISDTSELSICIEDTNDMNGQKSSQSYIQVNDESTIIRSRVLDAGGFPEYPVIFARDIIGGIKINRTRLIKGLQRVSVLSNPKLHRVKLSIHTDKLCISCQTDSLGEALEEIDIEHIDNVTTIDIYLNAKHLIEGLLHMNDDKVAMEYSSELLPIFFKSTPVQNHIFVLCPMKLMD